MKDFEKVFGTKEQIKTSFAIIMVLWLVLIVAHLVIGIFVPMILDITALKAMAVFASITGIIYAVLDWKGW